MKTEVTSGVVTAVFPQLGNDQKWDPLAFYSKTMATTEPNYDTRDKEMLAKSHGLCSCWQGSSHIIGVYSDQKALEYFMSAKVLNAHQPRWAEILSEYHLIIKYRAGQVNAAAVAVTRREQGSKPQSENEYGSANSYLIRRF